MLFNPRHLSRIKCAHASGNDGEFKSKSNKRPEMSGLFFFKLTLSSLEVHVKILSLSAHKSTHHFLLFQPPFLNRNINESSEMIAIVLVCAVVKSPLHSLNPSLCSLSFSSEVLVSSLHLPSCLPRGETSSIYLQVVCGFWSNLNKNGRRASASLPLDKSGAAIIFPHTSS